MQRQRNNTNFSIFSIKNHKPLSSRGESVHRLVLLLLLLFIIKRVIEIEIEKAKEKEKNINLPLSNRGEPVHGLVLLHVQYVVHLHAAVQHRVHAHLLRLLPAALTQTR